MHCRFFSAVGTQSERERKYSLSVEVTEILPRLLLKGRKCCLSFLWRNGATTSVFKLERQSLKRNCLRIYSEAALSETSLIPGAQQCLNLKTSTAVPQQKPGL